MPIYPYSFQLPPLNVQDIPNDGAPGEFLGINVGGALDWLPAGGGGSGDMLAANNLSELTNFATARTNIGLGTTSTPTFANLTLTSPSLASSAPVTISQTWNAVGQTFKALVVNAAGTSGTNSASGSLLADFQTGGVSQVSINKDGRLLITTQGGASTPSILIGGGGAGFYQPTNTQISFASNSSEAIRFTGSGIRLGLNELGFGSAYNSNDTILLRDGAANTLALRNGAAAQTFNVYGTYITSPSLAYSRLAISCDTSGNATLITQSTGAAGNLQITGQNELRLGVGASWQWRVNSSGHFQAGTDNTYDIGASGASRPRNVYVAGNVSGVGGLHSSATSLITFSNSTTLTYAENGGYHVALQRNGNGVLALLSQSGGFLLQFAGTTNLFPAIKRNAAGLQIRLADDSANATLEAGNLYASGNVGIGTTAPGAKLHVLGNAIFGETTPVLTATPINVSFGGTYGSGTPGSKANLKWDLYTNSSNGDRYGIGMSAGLMEFQAGAAAGFGFYPNAGTTSALQILSSGNVGIGTTSPTSKLHVVGNALFGENSVSTSIVNVSFGGSYGTAPAGSKANLKWDLFNDGITANRFGIGMSVGIMEFQAGAGAGFGFYPNNTTVSALHIPPSGNVGIGTITPTSKLQVNGGDIEIFTIASGLILKSPDGTRYRVTVANGGTLSVAAV